MGIFNQRKPRGFSHQYIYVDERREKLKAMEERAKRELGLIPEPEKTAEERIRGRFVEQTSHLRRQQEKGGAPRPSGLSLLPSFWPHWCMLCSTDCIVIPNETKEMLWRVRT